MRFLKNPQFKLIDKRKLGFTISSALLVLSIVSLILHGGPRFGIDFRGGTLIEIRFEDKNNPQKELAIPINDVRDVFTQYGLEQSEIKHYGSLQEIAVQIDVAEEIDSELMSNIYQSLESKFPENNVIERRREKVGPKIGSELVVSAVWSILVALLLILIYIMFRFEFRFGVGAVMALFHDVLITLGVFSLIDIEISIPIVAALLTIIGYSLNDTIVVFDRIRENLKTFKRQASNYASLVNRSVNETLSRTVVTSGTTLIVVLVLYFFGGEIINDFAFALILGVIIGTYSSIFVASPLLVEWEARKSVSTSSKSKRK
ncbi:protein translocase subunit SecF [Candidatus Saccharibacteria bacterium]|nr:protein translocase subunit SecF [Calditrichia bacterium]NIV71795.1 protein translocase subunit SecF [Calditrichia bacterium]NIV99692.1 protein translocase subunit SecF [Candidatus Saccharibacteria bacterium]